MPRVNDKMQTTRKFVFKLRNENSTCNEILMLVFNYSRPKWDSLESDNFVRLCQFVHGNAAQQKITISMDLKSNPRLSKRKLNGCKLNIELCNIVWPQTIWSLIKKEIKSLISLNSW